MGDLQSKIIPVKVIEGLEPLKKIKVGDACYFSKFNELVYQEEIGEKSNLVGRLELYQEALSNKDKEVLFTANCFRLVFYDNEEDLRLFDRELVRSDRKKKRVDIGVDTASFEFHINDGYELFRTGSDGLVGYVYELRNKGDIKLLSIDMTVNDYYSMDELESLLKSLLNIE